MEKIKAKVSEKVHKHWHKAFIGGHASYFSGVALESHGHYAMIAGVLAVMVIIGAWFHLGE